MAMLKLAFVSATPFPTLRRSVNPCVRLKGLTAVLQDLPKGASLPQDADSKGRRAGLATEEEPALEPAVKGYSWTEQWYPVAFEDDIVDGTPYNVTLFDTEMVFFRSGNGYVALDDRCPHRLASLSEGRVVSNGTDECSSIECPYHGWTFAGDGECTRIPQVTDPDPSATIPRTADAQSFPTTVSLKIIFVWLGNPSRADPSLLPLPEVDFSKEVLIRSGITRIVPYSYEILGENLSDPAHVQFAHHGASPIANRGIPFGENFEHSFKVVKNAEGSWSTRYGKKISSVIPRPDVIWFTPGEEKIGNAQQILMWTPVGRRRARMMILTIIEKPTLLAKVLFKLRPRWSSHQETMTFLDGDATMLVNVERTLGDPRSWRSRYGPPAGESDKLVILFRRFMDKYRDAMPWTSPEPVYSTTRERMPKEEILERLHSHTKICTSCSGALHRFERALKIISVVKLIVGFMLVCIGFTGMLVTGNWLTAVPMPFLGTLSIICVALLSASVMIDKWCRACIEGFVYSEEAKDKFLNAKEFVRK